MTTPILSEYHPYELVSIFTGLEFSRASVGHALPMSCSTSTTSYISTGISNSYSFRVSVTVPSAVALFPNEVLMRPKTLMSQQMPNMVSYTIMPKGGHFAALEEPLLLADDLWKFVDIVEKKYKL
ncbi:epoxide hydrolase [Trichonephila clavipes]|nr:epoxide hydrolase [Trichonephila clavipes]